jgi:ubiquinone/menaquinone biosynthesis C-methylase UbiE
MPPDEDKLYQDPELAQFYDLENGWADDFDYCLQLAVGAQSVLDLGCGTGQLAAKLAEGRGVVGVDPAAAMLEVARQRSGGEAVTWVQADARSLRLGQRFDLVVFTGHAFQVFLTEEDQKAVLATIARHLGPGGRFIFDSRNPAIEAWRDWTPEATRRRLEHPELGGIEAWSDVAQDGATGIVTYQTHYRVLASGKCLSASSKIRFSRQEQIAVLLAAAGLKVEEWLGDWRGGPCNPSGLDIIPIGCLK